MSKKALSVLHLATVDHGGAGIAALNLHKAMMESGQKSLFFAVSLKMNVSDCYKVRFSAKSRFKFILQKIISRLFTIRRFHFKYRVFKVADHASILSSTKIPKQLDLLIVHSISEFLEFESILEIQKKTGCHIVFHLLDMEHFTGGCHFSWDCRSFQTSCKHCRATILNLRYFTARSCLAEKKKYLDQMDYTVVCPSSTLHAQASSSYLFSSASKKKIFLGINADFFKPNNEILNCNDEFYVKRSAVKILAGARNLNDPRKGLDILYEALRILKKKRMDISKIDITLIGGEGNDLASKIKELGFKVNYEGTLSEVELRNAYDSNDIFVCPSVEDSGPTMANQAAVMGLSLISFDTGVTPDLIRIGCKGRVASDITAKALAAIIQDEVLELHKLLPDQRVAQKRAQRQFSVSRVSTEHQVAQFLDIVDSKI